MKPTKDYKRTVFVGNLPFDIDEESVRKHFDVCGEVEAVRLIRDKTTGIGKGFGYVTFHLKESVDDAIAMAGTKLNRRTLRVFKAKKNPTATGNVSRNDAAIVRRRKAGTERFEGRRASKPSKKTAKTIKMKRKRSLSSSNKPKHKKKRQRHG